jgi:hypothetical protein
MLFAAIGYLKKQKPVLSTGGTIMTRKKRRYLYLVLREYYLSERGVWVLRLNMYSLNNCLALLWQACYKLTVKLNYFDAKEKKLAFSEVKFLNTKPFSLHNTFYADKLILFACSL